MFRSAAINVGVKCDKIIPMPQETKLIIERVKLMVHVFGFELAKSGASFFVERLNECCQTQYALIVYHLFWFVWLSGDHHRICLHIHAYRYSAKRKHIMFCCFFIGQVESKR